MKIPCHKIKMRVLENDGLVASELEHVENCPDCLGYSQTLNRAMDHISDKEPPATVDQAILLHARSRSRSHSLPTIIYFKLAATAAAALITIFVGVEAYRRWTQPVKTPNTVVKSDQPRGERDQDEPQEDPRNLPSVSEMVAGFDWDNDNFDEELTAIEAEFLLLTSDDNNADLVSDLL